jgi:uncharacterized protein
VSDVQVSDHPDEQRWEARVDGELAGAAYYEREDDIVAFVHTEVEPAYEGHGVGSALARTALDAARAQGLRVVPRCPFIKGWIDKHPDYQDLVLGA